MSPTREEEICLLKAQVEELDRSLNRWVDTSMPAYRRTIRLKQDKQAALDRLLRLSQGPDSPEQTEPGTPWYESHPDVLRRRQIVLKNPNLSAATFAKLFDIEEIPLLSGWEDKFGETRWAEVYKDKKGRALIQKLVSTEKKKG